MAEVINACCLCIIKKLLKWNCFKRFITRCQWWAGQGMPRALVWTGSQSAPPVRTRPRSVRSSLWSCSRQPSCSCHQRSFFHLQHSNVSEEGVLQMHLFQIKMAWCKTGFFWRFYGGLLRLLPPKGWIFWRFLELFWSQPSVIFDNKNFPPKIIVNRAENHYKSHFLPKK